MGRLRNIWGRGNLRIKRQIAPGFGSSGSYEGKLAQRVKSCCPFLAGIRLNSFQAAGTRKVETARVRTILEIILQTGPKQPVCLAPKMEYGRFRSSIDIRIDGLKNRNPSLARPRGMGR